MLGSLPMTGLVQQRLKPAKGISRTSSLWVTALISIASYRAPLLPASMALLPGRGLDLGTEWATAACSTTLRTRRPTPMVHSGSTSTVLTLHCISEATWDRCLVQTPVMASRSIPTHSTDKPAPVLRPPGIHLASPRVLWTPGQAVLVICSLSQITPEIQATLFGLGSLRSMDG